METEAVCEPNRDKWWKDGIGEKMKENMERLGIGKRKMGMSMKEQFQERLL